MTAAEMMMARLRPRHDRGHFAASMRSAGLDLCEDCGWWSSDTRPVAGKKLCGECGPPVKCPDPALFGAGTLEHMMASRLAAKETA